VRAQPRTFLPAVTELGELWGWMVAAESADGVEGTRAGSVTVLWPSTGQDGSARKRYFAILNDTNRFKHESGVKKWLKYGGRLRMANTLSLE
jgi:hypothetical protein